MRTIHYCVQCKESRTGKIGCFTFREGTKWEATSPIFPDLHEFFKWRGTMFPDAKECETFAFTTYVPEFMMNETAARVLIDLAQQRGGAVPSMAPDALETYILAARQALLDAGIEWRDAK